MEILRRKSAPTACDKLVQLEISVKGLKKLLKDTQDKNIRLENEVACLNDKLNVMKAKLSKESEYRCKADDTIQNLRQRTIVADQVLTQYLMSQWTEKEWSTLVDKAKNYSGKLPTQASPEPTLLPVPHLPVGSDVLVSPRWDTCYAPPTFYFGSTTSLPYQPEVSAGEWAVDVSATMGGGVHSRIVELSDILMVFDGAWKCPTV
jgi:hypothetical protein